LECQASGPGAEEAAESLGSVRCGARILVLTKCLVGGSPQVRRFIGHLTDAGTLRNFEHEQSATQGLSVSPQTWLT